MRAIHQTADEEPKILADSIAPRLVDTRCDHDKWLTQMLGHPFAKQLRAGWCAAARLDFRKPEAV